MKDSVIKGNGNSRYLKSSLDGITTWEQFRAALEAGTLPVDLNGINPEGFQQLGDSLNKVTLLKDTTAGLYGKDNTAVPDDLFKLLSTSVQGKLVDSIPAGMEWNAFNVAISYDFRCIAHHGDTVIATLLSGDTKKIARSVDGGKTWELVTIPNAEGQFAGTVAYCHGLFFAVFYAGNGFYVSPDGKNWTHCEIPDRTGIEWRQFHVVYGNGRFVFSDNYQGGYTGYSDDGYIWGKSNAWEAIWASPCFNGENFVITAERNGSKWTATSPDGETWTSLGAYNGADSSTVGLYNIVYRDGVYVACGHNSSADTPLLYRSTDAINWEKVDSGTQYSDHIELFATKAGFASFRHIRTANDGLAYKISKDGRTWVGGTLLPETFLVRDRPVSYDSEADSLLTEGAKKENPIKSVTFHTSTGALLFRLYDIFGALINIPLENVRDAVGSAVRAVVGSYKGTNTSGKNAPNTLTLGFCPKLLIIEPETKSGSEVFTLVAPVLNGAELHFFHAVNQEIYTEGFDTGVKFWSPNGYYAQMNYSTMSYHYVAIG